MGDDMKASRARHDGAHVPPPLLMTNNYESPRPTTRPPKTQAAIVCVNRWTATAALPACQALLSHADKVGDQDHVVSLLGRLEDLGGVPI
jgi:hypothetical protein